jgi:murein endopeptidase
VRILLAVLLIVPVTAAAVSVAALADEPATGLAELHFPDAHPAPVVPPPPVAPVPPPEAPIHWRRSTPLGTHAGGRLVNGVQLPAERTTFFTWDPVLRRTPNRPWRRWGTDRLVRVILRVARDFHAAHPEAPRLTVGDLSRPRGGDFGPRYGLPGHASHQNGLDVDLYYPRLDRKELSPNTVEQIDLPLSQDLVGRFVDAGAEVVFVGPNTGLEGPPGVVVPLANHDNHLHVRLPG